MQLAPLAKMWLPEVKQKFTNELQLKSAFECYGIHLGIPQLQCFKGGFILSGKFDKVDVNDEACMEISTNGLDFFGAMFAPEVIRLKMRQLDTLYDHVHHFNPKFASYFMKPADIVDTFNKEGLSGVTSKLGEKTERFLSKTPLKDIGSALSAFEELKKISPIKFEGGREGMANEEKWDVLDARNKGERNHLQESFDAFANTPPHELLGMGQALMDPDFLQPRKMFTRAVETIRERVTVGYSEHLIAQADL
jgi:hypothetical protein